MQEEKKLLDFNRHKFSCYRSVSSRFLIPKHAERPCKLKSSIWIRTSLKVCSSNSHSSSWKIYNIWIEKKTTRKTSKQDLQSACVWKNRDRTKPWSNTKNKLGRSRRKWTLESFLRRKLMLAKNGETNRNIQNLKSWISYWTKFR